MPYSSIPLNMRFLLLEPRHAKYHIIVGDIGDDEVDRMAPLCSGAIPHAYHPAYNGGSAQRLAIDLGNRWQLPFPRRLQAETMRYSLGDEVACGARVDKR